MADEYRMRVAERAAGKEQLLEMGGTGG